MVARKQKKSEGEVISKEKNGDLKDNVQLIRIKLQGYDHKVIDNCARQLIETALRYGVDISGPIPLPTEIKKFTVNRSSFVHKDSREQFEMRIHKRLLIINKSTPQMIEALSNFEMPAGVDVEIKM
jgi:small subunit ribosomal protein S10